MDPELTAAGARLAETERAPITITISAIRGQCSDKTFSNTADRREADGKEYTCPQLKYDSVHNGNAHIDCKLKYDSIHKGVH